MLTTPQLKDFDHVFPGEKWFFYWKTSASLWEGKLSEYNTGSTLYVPINWGLHSENPDQYDFGSLKPEADLAKLVDIAKKKSVEIIFLLQLSPVPYLPNGGIPSFVAKTHAVSPEGLYMSAIDSTGKVNKLFSFYNPRVFQYYQKFLVQLQKYFSEKSISNKLAGLDAFYFDGEREISFFEDESRDFNAGLQRYINQKIDESGTTASVDHFFEQQARKEYNSLLMDLYLQTSKEIFKNKFLGSKKYMFLGGDTEAYIYRSFPTWKEKANFFEDIFYSLNSGFIPSSSLLDEEEKSSLIRQCMKDITKTNFIKEKMSDGFYEAESFEFSLLRLFHLQNISLELFQSLGLKEFFVKRFCWSYCFHSRFDLEKLEEELNNPFICSTHNLDEEGFSAILKAFMFGAKVILDTSKISIENERRLTIFLTENSIETEKINMSCPLTLASLGEGKLFLFNSEDLAGKSIEAKLKLWNTICDFINVKHPECDSDSDVYYFWQTRFSNTYELNYEQIRRVCIYNPSSYKKKCHIHQHKNFAFVKAIDENEVSFKSSASGVSVELKPGGSIALDYGYFE